MDENTIIAKAIWFPAIAIPDGLSADDLAVAAGMIHEWMDEWGDRATDDEPDDISGEWTAIPLVIRIYQFLSASIQKRQKG